MKNAVVLAAAVAAGWAFAQEVKDGMTVRFFDRDVYVRDKNYDRSKIGPYVLEDPLMFVDGRRVRTAADWVERRREILGIFAREMYGAEPPPPEAVVTELKDEKVTVGGFAVRRQYRMWFRADRTGPCVTWTVWLPRHAKGPSPIILFLNYRGSYELVPDPDLPVPDVWVQNNEASFVSDHRPNEKTRGALQNPDSRTVFPIGTLLARGYAVMSACYAELSPDPAGYGDDQKNFPQHKFCYTGLFDLWGRRDPARMDDITALGAWGWALSRGLDLAERIREIDAKRSLVTGYSRLAKAALVAAARDERFAVCVPIQTGGGGVPLAKREFGENVSTINLYFSHWFCKNYAKYAEDPAKTLTFDQHLFLACLAPRALLVEGFDDPWYDTEGEYLAVRAASPVWKLLGRGAMPDVPWPDSYETSAIGRDLGYVRRTEKHGMAACDWSWMLDFADGVFGRK